VTAVSDDPESRSFVPLEEALRILGDGSLEPLGLMTDASNATFLVEVCDADTTLLAIYKPRAGEAPLWDFPEGTLYRREVAAYLLSAALGWPNIPPTVLRDGIHGPGAVQLFVEADLREHYFTLRHTRLRDFTPVAAFDVVANNADRKSGHCLLDAGGDIWFIDHGVCFNTEPKLRTVIWELAGTALPDALAGDLRRVAADLRSGPLREAMAALLSETEVDATARRAERLARVGRYPVPNSRRPYPWPPV
jgi:uncharacterized repeat protein (TIGR03843 family)